MPNLQDLWLRLRALFLRKKVEEELDDEIAFHVEMQIRKNLEAGMNVEDARREATRRLGSPSGIKEDCRDERRINPVETLLRDTRYAIRGFRRAPLFALTVIATISLGLGINTAVFTIFNAYVLRPLAVRDPYSLYQFNWLNRARRGHLFSWTQFQELRSDTTVFSDVYAARTLNSRVNGRAVFVELVSGNYFDAVGVGPAAGRVLSMEDARKPGSGTVAVLSYRAWRTIFGGDPAIVGSKISLRGTPLTVIGVAHEGFEGLYETPQDIWVPLTISNRLTDWADPFADHSAEVLSIFVRLKAKVSEAQALAATNIWVRQLGAKRPDNDQPAGGVLSSRATTLRFLPEDLLLMTPILGAFGLILLTACANVANMMLARAAARQREIGIRLSLGAARSRLIRQLLTESVLLALPAAALGFLISRYTVDVGVRLMYSTLPVEFSEFVRVVPLSPDLRVFLFMIAAAVTSGLIFGLVPALQATRANVMQAARGDFDNELRPERMRNALVVVQITISVALLIGSGILLRAANGVRKLDIGLRTRDVLAVEPVEKFRNAVVEQVNQEGIVETFGAASRTPLDSGLPSAFVSTGVDRHSLSSYDFVSPEFFSIFDLAILRGRNFTSSESKEGAPVALISNALARRLWPAGDEIGSTLRLASDFRSRIAAVLPFRQSTVEIIGVVPDVNTGLIEDENSRLLVYLPTHKNAVGNTLLVRVKQRGAGAREILDRNLSAAVPGGVDRIHQMDQFVAGRLYPFQIAYWISAVLGGLALLLTIAGTYGVLSYLVAQRNREFGVRMALGAAPFAIIRLVLGQSLRLAVIGAGSGALLAFALAKALASGLTVIRGFDQTAFAAGIITVVASCLAAAFFPSRRASQIDPMNTLRHD